jgi:hypothetical protein
MTLPALRRFGPQHPLRTNSGHIFLFDHLIGDREKIGPHRKSKQWARLNVQVTSGQTVPDQNPAMSAIVESEQSRVRLNCPLSARSGHLRSCGRPHLRASLALNKDKCADALILLNDLTFAASFRSGERDHEQCVHQ